MNGVITVARQEFRTRIRTGRWKILIGAWFGVVGAFTMLLRASLGHPTYSDGPPGIPMFGGLMLFVLGLAMLVAPALTAQSINGDRERGTLATLQVTRLTPAEIGLGKLLASWLTLLAFLGLTLPYVGWSVAEGGVGAGRAVIVLGVVVLLTGVILAVAQALSALVVRGITSTMLSYLTVFALTVGTLIAFGLALQATTEMVDRGDYSMTREHPERVWWLLAPNPFVVLADSAPLPPLIPDEDGALRRPLRMDPLSGIAEEVRESRLPPRDDHQAVDVDDYNAYRLERERLLEQYAVWPYGLAFNLALGAGAIVVTVRRLRTPARDLPRGVRVA